MQEQMPNYAMMEQDGLGATEPTAEMPAKYGPPMSSRGSKSK